jgi:putative NADH-flavin reductase
MQELNVLIVGVGGLGKCMVSEALERGVCVSLLVRDMAKLKVELGSETLARVSKIIVGDGSQAALLDEAMHGIDVVLSGRGADPHLAVELAAAVKRHDVKKLCWPGGSTNVMADDGITPNYQRLQHLGSWVEEAYRVHGACIDAIRQANINYVIFCPGRMASVGKRSADVRASVRINRDGGDFISYEDAAWVMLEAAATNTYDRELISAGTGH